MGRKVIVMVNEFGNEHTTYLLHSHDLFIDTEASVGGGVSAVANAAVSRSNRSLSNMANFNGYYHSDNELNNKVSFFCFHLKEFIDLFRTLVLHKFKKS